MKSLQLEKNCMRLAYNSPSLRFNLGERSILGFYMSSCGRIRENVLMYKCKVHLLHPFELNVSDFMGECSFFMFGYILAFRQNILLGNFAKACT